MPAPSGVHDASESPMRAIATAAGCAVMLAVPILCAPACEDPWGTHLNGRNPSEAVGQTASANDN